MFVVLEINIFKVLTAAATTADDAIVNMVVQVEVPIRDLETFL